MHLETIPPHPLLAPHVHHFWVFSSATGLPGGDARIVVPNGRHKLIFTYKNGLTAQSLNDASRQEHHAGDPVVVGLWETPTIISSSPAETCTIGVELLPHGLACLVPHPAQELTGRIVSFSDVFGNEGRRFGQRLLEAPSVQVAVTWVQHFLLAQLQKGRGTHDVVQAALRVMAQSGYRLTVNELEQKMGYSRRYLQALFTEHVGLPPKRLSSVLTFERLYRSFSRDKSVRALRVDALDHFYDQAHFIHAFRRFTGSTPSAFADLENEFGRLFYLPTSGATAE